MKGPLDRLIRADRKDEAEALLKQISACYPDRLYVELQRHRGRNWRDTEPHSVDLAYRLGLPLVATNEPFFPHPDDFEAHDALMCIADGAYVHQDDRRTATPDHYFKSEDEMVALFKDLPEAISNTVEIAQRCAFRPRTRDPILPRFVEAGSSTSDLEAEADGAGSASACGG